MKGKAKKIRLFSLTLIFSFMFLFSYSAKAETFIKRLSGENRYETAAKICEEGFKADTSTAIVVTGEDYPDALSAAPLAKKYNAPILLTSKDNLNMYTSVELKRLNVKTVFLIGGKGVISQSVEDGIKAMGIKVTRLAGATRYDTALEVAKKVGSDKQIVIVNGEEFTDALSIASIAAFKNMPIILTNKDEIPQNVQKYLNSKKKAEQIYVIGGEDLISAGVFNSIPNARRIGNGDKYQRNVQVIEAFQNEINFDTVYIATGNDYPDALAGAALASINLSPIVLIDEPINIASRDFLKSKIVSSIKILGGKGSVSSNVEYAVKVLPLAVANTNNITRTIMQGDKFIPPNTMIVTASDGKKMEREVEWNLNKVNTTKPGMYTFYGKVNGYDKDVTLNLIIKPIPLKINDIVAQAQNRESYVLPKTVQATMSDNTISELPVQWSYGTESGSKPGVYVFEGTVDGYSKKIKLTLTIKKYIVRVDDLTARAQKISLYVPPKYVKALMSDSTYQNVEVKWQTPTQNSKNSNVYIYKGVVPGYGRIITLTVTIGNSSAGDGSDSGNGDGNGNGNTGDPNGSTVINIDKDNFSDEVIQDEKYTMPKTVRATMSDGSIKDVTIKWDIDKVDTSNIGILISKGKIDGYNGEVTLTLNIIPKIVFIPDVVKVYTRNNVTSNPSTSNRYYLPTTVLAIKSDHSIVELPVKWKLDVIDTSSLGRFTVLGTVENYKKPVKFTLEVVRDTIVYFSPDKKLENVVRNKIGKPNGKIYLSDLEQITELDVSGQGITNIFGIKNMRNLKSLNLSGNNITNIQEVKYLGCLEELNLSGNRINDIVPLTDLITLKSLNLANNQVDFLGPLENLCKLETLMLSGNPNIYDYSPIIYYYNRLKNKDFSF